MEFHPLIYKDKRSYYKKPFLANVTGIVFFLKTFNHIMNPEVFVLIFGKF